MERQAASDQAGMDEGAGGRDTNTTNDNAKATHHPYTRSQSTLVTSKAPSRTQDTMASPAVSKSAQGSRGLGKAAAAVAALAAAPVEPSPESLGGLKRLKFSGFHAVDKAWAKSVGINTNAHDESKPIDPRSSRLNHSNKATNWE